MAKDGIIVVTTCCLSLLQTQRRKQFLLLSLLFSVMTVRLLSAFQCPSNPYASRRSKIDFHSDKLQKRWTLNLRLSTTSEQHAPSPLENPNKSNKTDAVLHQYHSDMRRVLENRRVAFHETYPNRFQERRRRPATLDSDKDGAERCYTMLQHLRSLSPLVPNEESFRVVMEAFLQRGRLRWIDQRQKEGENRRKSAICAADQLPDLLEELSQIVPFQEISMETYSLVLEAYANCATPRGNRDYAGKARKLLNRIEAMPREVIDSRQLLTAKMHVLRAFAWQQANRQDDYYCVQQVQELLHQIQEECSDVNVLMPCFDWALEAWSKSGAPESAETADEIFRQMKAMNATLISVDCKQNTQQILDAETYCNCVLAWAKSPGTDGPSKAHALLESMIEDYSRGAFPVGSEPSLMAFNSVMSAWARIGKAEKAEKVLFLLEDLRPSCRSLVPDTISYNSVLHAHLRNPNREQGLEKALKLVDYMVEESQRTPSLKPNGFTYHTLLKCWVQSGRDNKAQEAEALLSRMERLWERGDSSLKPTNRIFNTVINAYAKSNDWNAADRALGIVSRMKTLPTDCQPDVISYTSAIECLSKSTDPEAPTRAKQLLQEAFDRYEETKNPRDRPNARTFAMAIRTFANPGGSVVEARNLLSQLVELYNKTQSPDLMPTEYLYNFVLNSAANTLEQDAKTPAFQIAAQTYQEMRQSPHVKPDSFTYAFWLKCCNNLLPHGDLRKRCVTYAFEECKERGLVSNEVLSRLYHGNPPGVVAGLLAYGQKTEVDERSDAGRILKISDLPASWSRRASRNKR